MVRTIDFDGVLYVTDQVRAVPGNEQQNRVEALLQGPLERLVSGGDLFGVVDHQQFHWSFARFQSEAKLLLERAEDAGIGTTIGIGTLGCEVHNETVIPGQAGHIENRTAQIGPTADRRAAILTLLSRSRELVRSWSR